MLRASPVSEYAGPVPVEERFSWQFRPLVAINPLQTTWFGRGTVRSRVALLLRSTEVSVCPSICPHRSSRSAGSPLFWRRARFRAGWLQGSQGRAWAADLSSPGRGLALTAARSRSGDLHERGQGSNPANRLGSPSPGATSLQGGLASGLDRDAALSGGGPGLDVGRPPDAAEGWRPACVGVIAGACFRAGWDRLQPALFSKSKSPGGRAHL